MAQRQFRTDDTSTWSDRFGNGSDGAYAPSTGEQGITRSACTGTINTTSLSATHASFAAGQLILIYQTRGTGAGQWELNKISSYTAGTITLAYSLIFGYVTGAQVLVMPQCSSGNIAGGVTVTVPAWDGSTGGIFAQFCNGTYTIAGSLVGTGVGFRRGTAVGGVNAVGNNGEGSVGASSQTTNKNGNGGGGGAANGDGRAGAGGGNAAAGTDGFTAGQGGDAVGIANLTTIFMGGGGGAGGQDDSATDGNNHGGAGGAIVLIIAKTIPTITGTISLGGNNGVNSNASYNGAGGGGAGGSCLLKGQTIDIGTTKITVAAGTGGTGSSPAGGAGSVGRIHADYSATISGSTSPTIDSTQDSIFADRGGGFLFF